MITHAIATINIYHVVANVLFRFPHFSRRHSESILAFRALKGPWEFREIIIGCGDALSRATEKCIPQVISGPDYLSMYSVCASDASIIYTFYKFHVGCTEISQFTWVWQTEQGVPNSTIKFQKPLQVLFLLQDLCGAKHYM